MRHNVAERTIVHSLLRPPTQAGQRRSLGTNCIAANVVTRRVIDPGKKAAVVVVTR